MILFLHAALFVVLSSFRLTSVMSLLHASFHLRFGRPLLLFPGMSTSSEGSLYMNDLITREGGGGDHAEIEDSPVQH